MYQQITWEDFDRRSELRLEASAKKGTRVKASLRLASVILDPDFKGTNNYAVDIAGVLATRDSSRFVARYDTLLEAKQVAGDMVKEALEVILKLSVDL